MKPKHLCKHKDPTARINKAFDKFTKAEAKEILKRAKSPKEDYLEFSEGLKYADERLQEHKMDEVTYRGTRYRINPEEGLQVFKDDKWETMKNTPNARYVRGPAIIDATKRQIITAVCLTAAFVFGLWVLIQILPNPWL